MKKHLFFLSIFSLIVFTTTIYAQKPIPKTQSFSDSVLLNQLIKQEAENGLAILVDLGSNKIISKSGFVKNVKGYKKDLSLFNIAIEPGSLMIPLSAAVIMDNFGVKPTDSIDLEQGKTIINGRAIVDAEQHGIGFANLETIIAESSNVGIAKMVNNSFNNHTNQFNFEDIINDYVGDSSKIKKGNDANLLPLQSIGYGIQLTPDQIFQFYLRLANSDPSLFKNPLTGTQIKQAMEEVVENGTAKHLLENEKLSIAAKTGTSLVIGKNGYTNNQYLSSFVGFSDAIHPRFICLVMIKCKPNTPNHFGATVAGPVFATLLQNAAKNRKPYKIVNQPFEIITPSDSVQDLLFKNKKYYHHLEDSISNIMQAGNAADSVNHKKLKSFIIDGKEYYGYDGGAIGYYMRACWKNALSIIKTNLPISINEVNGCGNRYDEKSKNHTVHYYNCSSLVKTNTETAIGEPILLSKSFDIIFYENN